MSAHTSSVIGDLAFEPTPFRVRAYAHGRPLADSYHALLVWEPRRVVPMYAVRVADLSAELVKPATAEGLPTRLPPVLGPHMFRRHTTPGQSWSVRAGEEVFEQAAFRPSDPDLADHVVLDFAAFEWQEEEETVIGHPHDPFKRIDIRDSRRHVMVELDGVVLAESSAPRMLAETHLPVRWYLPPSDVHLGLLEHSDHHTTCAYKGHASHYSYPAAGRLGRDLAWTYERPLHEAEAVRGRISFYNERVDLLVDGTLQQRPRTMWSLDDRAT